MAWNLDAGIDAVTKRYLELYGAMQEGDNAAFILNDAVVVLSKENGTVKIHVIAGVPDRLDITLDLLEKKEAEGEAE